MKLIDNVNTRLIDDLKQTITKGSRLYIAGASFSIYAYEALKKELNQIDELQFIFSSPTFVEENLKKDARQFYIPHINNEADLCGGDFEIRLKNRLNQRAIAKECADWVKKKVAFKSNKNRMPLNGLIYIEGKNKNEFAYSGISSFTTADLGLSQRKGFPTLIQQTEYPHSRAYLEWFRQVWENDDELTDVSDRVRNYFENAYTDNSPEFIYFVTLYNIFNDFLEDLSLDNLPNDKVGFKESVIWNYTLQLSTRCRYWGDQQTRKVQRLHSGR